MIQNVISRHYRLDNFFSLEEHHAQERNNQIVSFSDENIY